jgi:hypothetical protein
MDFVYNEIQHGVTGADDRSTALAGCYQQAVF